MTSWSIHLILDKKQSNPGYIVCAFLKIFSTLKEVDEVVEAALEPHMEIRENENMSETGNNKLVVAQDVNWGEDDFYSGEEEFSIQCQSDTE